MPPAVPWEETELQTLAADPHSRIFSDQRKITVVLQPFHLQDLKSAVRDLLNAGVNLYDKSLDGIFLGYEKLKILSKSASVSAETSGVAIEIQANFFSFRPEVGCVLKGVVNKISNDHIGILVYQRFNVSCPRPGTDGKSAKWIGKNVVMHQEVMFKLKEKHFGGKLPFFKGKIMEIGNVVSGSNEQDKKTKKKSKEVVPDESILSDASSQVTKKSRKHKLDESEEHIEVKTKKARKDVETLKRPIERDADVSNAALELSPSKKKKKKRVSIGSVDETDFIPRFSLDVSQLPEDLPPPNADSTHFDVTRNLSMSMNSEKKKKKKSSNPDLAAIREESADGSKANSRLNDKSQQSTEEKNKKKLKASSQGPSISADDDAPPVKTPKKKKEKQVGIDLPPPSSPKKMPKQTETPFTTVEPTPIKEKKSKTPKKGSTSSQLNAGLDNEVPHSRASISVEEKPLLSPSKAKKKSKEDKLVSSPTKEKINSKDMLDSSPTKQKKKSKEDKLRYSPTKDFANSSLTSDDFIPPGQKSFRASPKKQHSDDSPWKEGSFSANLANSPGIEYFAGSRSMMDPALGTRMSGRQAPLMFGSLEGKIPPPPESPKKSAFGKKVDSDSDSDCSPQKMVITTTSQHDSDSSESEREQAPVPSKMTNSSPRKAKEYSSDSDSDTAAKNILLRSMGVMKSPLKTTKPVVKHDTSDSESEESSNEEKATKAGTLMNKNHSNIKSKTILAAESKSNMDATRSPSPKKASKTKAQNVSKASQVNQTKGLDSDSDDDLETMKAALLKIEENRNSKVKKSKSKPSKSNSKSDSLSKKATSEKKSTLKTMESVHQNSSGVNSVLSKPSEDSDSDTDLMKSALMKVAESGTAKAKAPRGKKVKPEDPDVSVKKTKAATVKKTKSKPNDSVSQVPSKTFTGDSDDDVDAKKKAGAPSKPSVDSDSDDEDLIKSVMVKVKEKLMGGESSPPKAARGKKSKSEDPNASVKKSKATPVKKTTVASQMPSKVRDDSDDEIDTKKIVAAPSKPSEDSDSDTDLMKSALMKVKESGAARPKAVKGKKAKSEDPEASVKKTKAATVKKTKSKPSDSVSQVPSKTFTDNSDDNLDAKKKAGAPSKPSVDSDSDDEDLIKSVMVKVKEKLMGGESSPPKAARGKKSKPENLNALSKVTKAATVKKTKLKQTDDISSSVKSINDVSSKDTKLTKKLKSPPAKNSSKSLPDSDSDSGPDDKNTTDKMEEMRQKKGSGSKTNLEKSETANKTGKSSKANTSNKVPLEENSINEKKQKSRGKKKASADDEISDVMQRLIRQAQLSIGMK